MTYVKFFMNKIVRDNIDWSREPGIFSEIVDLTPEEKVHHLKKKLLEEAEEVLEAETREDLVEEIADVYEVLDALMQKADINLQEVMRVKEEKKKRKGGFDVCHFAVWGAAPETDSFVAQARKQPEKYIEVPFEEE